MTSHMMGALLPFVECDISKLLTHLFVVLVSPHSPWCLFSFHSALSPDWKAAPSPHRALISPFIPIAWLEKIFYYACGCIIAPRMCVCVYPHLLFWFMIHSVRVWTAYLLCARALCKCTAVWYGRHVFRWLFLFFVVFDIFFWLSNENYRHKNTWS